MFKPRPHQAAVLEYAGGKMGVSAVPGSGKTHTLSRLAANIIISNQLEDDQEVLIVTLVNSAVDNFSQKVGQFINEAGLLPGFGYRVRTLHGLANDIVRGRPDLVGLPNRFQIVDERDVTEIIDSIVAQWLRGHPEFISVYEDQSISNQPTYKMHQEWQKLAVKTASSFIRLAKDLELTPSMIQQSISKMNVTHPLLDMGFEIYSNYQRALNYRGAVDFDDLIRLAIQALNTDMDYLNRLRYQWPFILEDEAQDSSRLQEKILRLLTHEKGNWVRVGDPNQAIYETFTTADPEFLKDFMEEPGVRSCFLPNSGRSTRSIIKLANHLISWTNNEHPEPLVRDALTTPPIEPTPPGDPQPNPVDQPDKINLVLKKLTADEEVKQVARSISEWLKIHPDETVAALVPRNERGAKLVDELKKLDVEYIEILRSSQSTRKTSEILANILRYLADPASAPKLAKVYHDLRKNEEKQNEQKEPIKAAHGLIRKCAQLEDFLYPYPGSDWLESLHSQEYPVEIITELDWFRILIKRWQNATLLPVDQLLLTIAQDLFTEPSDLALAHKLALVLENFSNIHPEWQLPELIIELDSIVSNERNFLGFSEEDNGFDPDLYKGKVVIATIHKAKGLEWDKVYILSVNSYDFPSSQPNEEYIGESWFVRNRSNLQAESLSKLNALYSNDVPGIYLEEGPATRQARLDYVAERLRLLFVGITRARKELTITWNTGRKGETRPSLPLVALQSILERDQNVVTR